MFVDDGDDVYVVDEDDDDDDEEEDYIQFIQRLFWRHPKTIKLSKKLTIICYKLQIHSHSK